jgi:two-component system nitrogen regulation response regulator NtrX
MKRRKVLIVDDDHRILSTLGDYLRDSGFDVITAATVSAGDKVNHDAVDAVLLDLALPDGNGLDLLRRFRSRFTKQACVMISGQATLQDAVKATKLGAVDFLEKPVSPEKVEITLRNALKLEALKRKHDQDKQEKLQDSSLVGESERMREIRSQIEAVSQTDASVLILGESGTGKEVVANMIHPVSVRRHLFY